MQTASPQPLFASLALAALPALAWGTWQLDGPSLYQPSFVAAVGDPGQQLMPALQLALHLFFSLNPQPKMTH
jgi:hypothetical protein